MEAPTPPKPFLRNPLPQLLQINLVMAYSIFRVLLVWLHKRLRYQLLKEPYQTHKSKPTSRAKPIRSRTPICTERVGELKILAPRSPAPSTQALIPNCS